MGRDPAAGFEPVQRGIERAFLDQDSVVGALFYQRRNGIAVQRAGSQRAEDQKVEGSPQQVEVGVGQVALPKVLRGRDEAGPPKVSMGETPVGRETLEEG